MTSVMIEGGLKLIDGAQVGEGSSRPRANLGGAPDRLRQVAVGIADLDRGHDHEGSNHEGRNQSSACIQAINLFVSVLRNSFQSTSSRAARRGSGPGAVQRLLLVPGRPHRRLS